ncbi:MAG: TraR/DksA C4-type zinc finger protein [Patescibacteria group bacterium]
MNKKDTEYFKNKLFAEKAAIEEELSSIGSRNPRSASGWEVTGNKIEVDPADENETADKMEEFEENSGIAEQLEKQLGEITNALAKIDTDKYGICEKCGEPIERERLEVNPSSRISIKHTHK